MLPWQQIWSPSEGAASEYVAHGSYSCYSAKEKRDTLIKPILQRSGVALYPGQIRDLSQERRM